MAALAQSRALPPPLIPPKIVTAETIAYPEHGQGDAVVVVELSIDSGGAVKDAKIIEGAEPFSAAVLARARDWKFVPARRGQVDVAARVRMRIEFHPPEVVPAPAQAEGRAPAADAPKKPPRGAVVIEREEEVFVRSVRPEPGKIVMRAAEVRQMPGAFGDAFRAMEALPGVTPIISGLPFFYVRGAPPSNTGYFLDGVRIPLLYHLAAGPGVVHPGIIDHVDFFTGGYPARYGRFTGGILAGYTRAPATTFHGEWNVRLVDTGGLVEAPIAGGRGSVLVAGRYGYPGLVVSLAAPEASISYWDYQMRASYRLTQKDTISAFWFGSSDYLGQIEENRATGEKENQQLFKTTFHRLDLRYDRSLGSTGNLRLALTFGSDETGLAMTGDSKVGNGRARSIGLRTEIENRVSQGVLVRAGADVVWENSNLLDPQGRRLTPDESPYSLIYTPRNDVNLGAHADVVWKLSRRVEITSGLRADVFTSRRLEQPVVRILDREYHLGEPASAAVGIDPRLATRVTITPKLAWLATFGISHQPPSTLIPLAGVGVGLGRRTLQTAVQASQGLELKLPLDFTATSNIFYHHYLDLSDGTATCGEIPIDDLEDPCLARRVRGRAFGFEFFLRRDLTKKLTGWVSYTLSRSTREGFVAGQAQSSKLEVFDTILAEFDRTHVLQLIGAYDLGRRWRAGLRFVYYSGRPYPRFGDNSGEVLPKADERLPPFYRFDVRLEKAWKIGERGRVAFVIEGVNVTLHKESVTVRCREAYPSNERTCKPEAIGPISIPSIGVEGNF